MKNSIFVISTVIVFIFCLSSSRLYAQQKNIESPENFSELVDVDSIIPKIESQFNIKIYYQPEWFANKKVRTSLLQLPLNQCIEVLSRTANLNCLTLSDENYVFVPVEIRNYSDRLDKKGVILIGEPNSSGENEQVEISGKILDFKTGKPLDAARLTIDKLNLNAISDRNGNYKLSLIPGDYDLRINFVGYDEDFRKIRVFGKGIVNFEISEQIIRLQEITVSDKAPGANLIKAQMSTINLNTKNIKELPSFLGVKDVLKGVTLLPGIQSTGEFGTGFFVRGGSADQNLILIENVPIFNSSHLFGLVSAINSDAISSVNLLKAGIPAGYGERASSVMDIQMKSNTEKFSGKGGIGLIDSRLNFEIPLFNNNVNLLFGGRSSYSNWLLHAIPDAELKNSSANFYDVNVLLKIKLSQRDNLSFFGYHSNDAFSFIKNSPYNYNNTIASLKYSHNFGDKLHLLFTTGYSNYRNDITSLDSLKPKEAYKISSIIKYNNAKLNFTWFANKKNTFDFGLNSVLYRLQPGKLTPYQSESLVNSQEVTKQQGIETSAYLSDNIEFSQKLSAEAGVRFSLYSPFGPGKSYVFEPSAAKTFENIIDTLFYNKNEVMKRYWSVEPRLSLRYSIDESSSLKLSYNRMSQVINLVSNTAVMSPTDVYNLSNPNIKPLINNQIAAGYYRNLKNNSIETSVEIYYKKSDNIVEFRNGASILLNDALETDLLNAQGYSYGIEFYLKKNTGKLTGWMSYTYSRAFRKTTSNFVEDQINRNQVFSSPFDIPHNFIINANYHLTRRWRLSGVFNFNTGKPITLPELKYDYNGRQYVYYSDRNKYRLPDYHRFDLAITYDESLRFKQKWKGSWTFSILNLYGHKNAYTVFYKSASQIESKFYRSFNLYKMYIIEKPVPTFTYNFTF